MARDRVRNVRRNRARRVLGAAGIVLAAAAGAAVRADTVAIEQKSVTSSMPRPARGATMRTVEAKFGVPQTRMAPVGDPPITRWVYPEFTVFFEYDRVIHTVVRR